MFSLEHITSIISLFIDHHGQLIYVLVFLAAIAEGTIFIAFVPGSLFILAVGAFAASGKLSFGLLFVLVVIGAFLGDNLGYIIGKFFGKKILSTK